MTFEEILDQAVAMLQRRGRVTYRVLKRQFDLDDDALEDLKEDILYSQPLVVDDEGKGLIWTGESGTKPEPAPTPTVQPEVTEQDRLTQPESSPEAPTPDAERRQLTVLFCDLVDSTALSGQLDPEDLRDVIQSYQTACAEVIQRFDGHVAQLLGDGLLVYFGYPRAHEDDAQRAIRAGLGMLEAMRTLNARLQGVRLAIRVGVHTGLVVVGEMGGGGRQEQLALGETPNIAARLQALAAPNTVVMSETTSQLAQGFFHCEDLGKQHLRGVSQPLNVYLALRESGAQSRLDVAAARGLTPLVGREAEVALLLDRWAQARDGSGQVVLLSGEAGIGKSRLAQVLKEHVAGAPHMRLECRSLPYYQNTALYPLTDLLQRAMQWEPEDTAEQKQRKLEQLLGRYQAALDDSAPLFASLLSLPLPEDRYPPLNLTPQRQRQRTLETLVAMLVEESERQPLLLIVEDLHWTDPTTLEWLELLIDQCATASILILLTCRPEFEPAWSHRTYLSELSLSRLTQAQIEQMVERVAHGKRLPDEVMRELIVKTDGVPLYLEEMTKSVIESGILKEHDGHYELSGSVSSLAIPATLHDSLMARLDRLESAKSVAQLGAVIGRQFSYELLQAISQLDEDALQQALGKLIEAELVHQRGLPPQATYTFKHALIQDIAYQSQLKRTRQQAHLQIVRTLEEQFPQVVETQPELLAHHCTEAELYQPAVDYWQRAGELAHQRTALEEARSHITCALAALRQMPADVVSVEQELELQIRLGHVGTQVAGWADAEVGDVFEQARQLTEKVTDINKVFPAYRGIFLFYIVQGNQQVAHEMAQRMLENALEAQEPTLTLVAHWCMLLSLCWRGQFAEMLTHAKHIETHYDFNRHGQLAYAYDLDPRVEAGVYMSHAVWIMGYPDQAFRICEAKNQQARSLNHPFALAQALNWGSICYLYAGRYEPFLAQLEESIQLAEEHGFALWLATGQIWRGHVNVQQGNLRAGIDLLSQGLTAYQQLGSGCALPYLKALLAQALSKRHDREAALTLISESLTQVDNWQERFHEAEIHRLKGEVYLTGSQPQDDLAESCFAQAISIAQEQQAKSWELRAATSLARLWQSQGKRQAAHELLQPVYEWFTEGFDTADLKDAKVLLDELS
jgi:class 3 adenylate cyclase/predicted ATPase